jgi:hypothetical protein
MTNTRAVTVYATSTGPMIEISGLTSGAAHGWRWNPTAHTLTNSACQGGFRLGDTATAAITAAIRAAVPPRIDRKGGRALSHMPEENRAGYEWDGSEDRGDPYVKMIPGVPARFDLQRCDVEPIR